MRLQRWSHNIRYSSSFYTPINRALHSVTHFLSPSSSSWCVWDLFVCKLIVLHQAIAGNPKNISGFQPCCIMNMRLITFISLVVQPVGGHSATLTPHFQIALRRVAPKSCLPCCHTVPLGAALHCQGNCAADASSWMWLSKSSLCHCHLYMHQ